MRFGTPFGLTTPAPILMIQLYLLIIYQFPKICRQPQWHLNDVLVDASVFSRNPLETLQDHQSVMMWRGRITPPMGVPTSCELVEIMQIQQYHQYWRIQYAKNYAG